MINEKFKLKLKILNGSIFKSQNQNLGSMKANMTLKIKVKVTNYRKPAKTLKINKQFMFEGKILNCFKANLTLKSGGT